ncbi:helix-turn-helix protein [Motilibacter rhizosphaerae]|uniref:Helix-turn-helix protein n=1 Tax=Motilibacter rhizosphaerae TaxID=598652 RepID=A0A4Q7NGX3_9ACTN|nr:helix-turn-helix transcriptional regulator [Motilibacter rhizosphaerae]RZS82696.1 helix-turn-helix protein [Motilibacter rhizosphaerae]
MHDSPSARERQLARELRDLRVDAQLQGKEVARLLGWSASKVSRIETGAIGIRPEDLELLLDVYAVPAPRAERLRLLAPNARPKGWWDAYADRTSAGYANLIRLEASSRAVQCYSAVIPHPLLQTEAWTRRVILATALDPSPAEVDLRMAICRRRQQLLQPAPDREPLRLAAVVDQAVLHRSVDPDPEVDRALRLELLRHLLRLGRRPNITVQVLPFSAGIPPVTAGSFSLLEPRGLDAPDVVYMDNKTRIFFLDSPTEVHAYDREMALLRTMALTPARSATWLRDAVRSTA